MRDCGQRKLRVQEDRVKGLTSRLQTVERDAEAQARKMVSMIAEQEELRVGGGGHSGCCGCGGAWLDGSLCLARSMDRMPQTRLARERLLRAQRLRA